MTVAAEIRALQAAPASELIARYRQLFGCDPPCTRRSWVFKRVAWQLQANEQGGLSERAQARLNALMAELPPPPPREGTVRATSRVPGMKRKGALLPGTVLTREYKGRTLAVTVLDEGVEFEGATYSSLTAVAKEVTGSKAINGRLWFGLTKRSRDR